MIDIKFIVAGVAAVVIFGSGWWLGYSKYLDFKKEVEIAAKTQEAKVESIQKQHELVTKGISNEYDAKLALLRQYYANGVRQPNSSSVPNLSAAASFADANTAYAILAGQCAETTQQIVSLQEWINAQMGIK
ncbi:hypothetical protein UFOVP202_51 [uncultured Caudovirales phage]|uniref:Uncharacterized protein n=1 Tax=uncultured Caudovirales phage TaxID=2100421 RepID=A0A6J7WJF9_9CAUD|nr:hypothetical protein UFOVP202_51 [uncultured Caudovirales phage]